MRSVVAAGRVPAANAGFAKRDTRRRPARQRRGRVVEAGAGPPAPRVDLACAWSAWRRVDFAGCRGDAGLFAAAIDRRGSARLWRRQRRPCDES